MKRILLLATLLVATTSVAEAQHRHYHHGGGYSGWALGAGVLGGLAAGALLAQPRPYYSEPMYMAPPPTPVRCYRRLEGYDIYGTPLYRRICEPVY